MDHVWTADMKSSDAVIFAVMNAIFCKCVKNPEKFRTSTGIETVTSRYRWAMKPLTMGAAHLWVLMFPWGMHQRWNDIWNGSNPLEVLKFSGFFTQIAKNCVHNCEDHSFTWFHIRSSYMIHFIYNFIFDHFLKSEQILLGNKNISLLDSLIHYKLRSPEMSFKGSWLNLLVGCLWFVDSDDRSFSLEMNGKL